MKEGDAFEMWMYYKFHGNQSIPAEIGMNRLLPSNLQSGFEIFWSRTRDNILETNVMQEKVSNLFNRFYQVFY